MTDKGKMFQFHQENVLALEEGLKFTLTNIKNGILNEYLSKQADQKKRHKRYILIQKRILSGLIVSWSETIIKRLYYEPNAFTEKQIEKLHGLNLQQQWEFALKVAFCKAYKIEDLTSEPLFNNVNIELQTKVGRSARDKFRHIRQLITDELLPAINIRNKVQHGEWIKAFKPPNSLDFSPELTREINRENIISLQTKINQFKAIYQLIHDLAVFKIGNNTTTFERDFDNNFNRVEHNNKLSKSRKEKDYKSDIIQRYERGLKWKVSNQKVIKKLLGSVRRVLK